jgi:benzoyl-CoA 2,3-dioxygenase component B
VGVYEPGKFASWIAAPKKGINNLPQEFEYVRFTKQGLQNRS